MLGINPSDFDAIIPEGQRDDEADYWQVAQNWLSSIGLKPSQVERLPLSYSKLRADNRTVLILRASESHRLLATCRQNSRGNAYHAPKRPSYVSVPIWWINAFHLHPNVASINSSPNCRCCPKWYCSISRLIRCSYPVDLLQRCENRSRSL